MILLLVVGAILVDGGISDTNYIKCYSCSNEVNIPHNRSIAANCNETFKSEGIPTCVGLTCVKFRLLCTGTENYCRDMTIGHTIRGMYRP